MVLTYFLDCVLMTSNVLDLSCDGFYTVAAQIDNANKNRTRYTDAHYRVIKTEAEIYKKTKKTSIDRNTDTDRNTNLNVKRNKDNNRQKQKDKKRIN